MKKLIFLFVLFGTLYAEFYKVNVTRIDDDLYKTLEEIYIKTRYYYEYVYYEYAILKYDDYSYDNELIFEHGSCEAEKIFN